MYQNLSDNLQKPQKIRSIEPVKEGYGEGGFIVISAQKEA